MRPLNEGALSFANAPCFGVNIQFAQIFNRFFVKLATLLFPKKEYNSKCNKERGKQNGS